MDDLALIVNFVLNILTQVFNMLVNPVAWILMTPIVFFVLWRVVKIIKKIV